MVQWSAGCNFSQLLACIVTSAVLAIAQPRSHLRDVDPDSGGRSRNIGTHQHQWRGRDFQPEHQPSADRDVEARGNAAPSPAARQGSPTYLPARDRLQFSWNTVPIYQQLCNPNATLSSAFPAERLQFLASHYTLITLEHCQGYYALGAGQAMEDYFVSAARELKSANANLTVLFYTNSVAGLSYYRWCSEAFASNPEWRLSNEKGDLCASHGGHMLPQYSGYDWDQRQPAAQIRWAELCRNLTISSLLDGCFIDEAGTCLENKTNVRHQAAGKVKAMTLAQQLAGPSKIVGAVGATASYDVQLSQIYTFRPDLKSLQWLKSCEDAGMIAEAHAQTNVGERGDHVNGSLAAFLIGAYEKSYFAFSTNPGAGYHPFCDGTAPSWCYGMGWIDDFNKPLGKPRGTAEVSDGGMHYQRQFSSGTNVTLDLRHGTCAILWADGSKTVCTTKFKH